MKLLFPVIDKVATGRNIVRLRKERGLSVRDLQDYFDFLEPQPIYQWQTGRSLASVQHLYALSYLFDVPIEEILVCVQGRLVIPMMEPDRTGSIVFVRLYWSRSAQAFLPCRLTIPMVIGFGD